MAKVLDIVATIGAIVLAVLIVGALLSPLFVMSEGHRASFERCESHAGHTVCQ